MKPGAKTAARDGADKAPSANLGSGVDLSSSYAYSDSITDLPMLEAVGHPVAVNPDRDLRRIAAERGWHVRDFRRPVRLRARLSSVPSTDPSLVRALLAGAALLLLGWFVLRPRAGRRSARRPAPAPAGRLEQTGTLDPRVFRRQDVGRDREMFDHSAAAGTQR